MRVNVLDGDGRLVHEDADGECQPTQGHDVDGLPCQPQADKRAQQRERDSDHDDGGTPQIAEEQPDDESSQQGAERPLEQQSAQRMRDVHRLIEREVNLDVLRDQALHPRNRPFHAIHDVQSRRVGALRHRDVDGAAAVHQRVAREEVARIVDRADVMDEHRRPRAGANRQVLEIFDPRYWRVDLRDAIEVAGANVTARQDRVARGDSPHHLVARQVECAQAIGIDTDDDRALACAERGRRRDAGQRRKDRPNPVERQVLNLADAARVAGEDQLSDRHGAGIEPDDERRHRSRRHEGAGAIDVRHRLRQRLVHVRTRLEVQPDQADVLNRLGLDVVNPGDVEEVILVVVDEITFHLRRVHAAVGLRDDDHREIQVRENVDGGAQVREPRQQPETGRSDEHTDRTAERQVEEPHGGAFLRRNEAIDERREVAVDLRQGEQRPPHGEPRNRVIGVRLREDARRVRGLCDIGEPAVVTRARPCFRLYRGLTLDRRVGGDAGGGLERRPGARVLRGEIVQGLIVMRLLGEQVLSLHLLARAQRKEVERGKRERRAKRPVRHLQREATAERRLPRHFGSAAAAEQRRLERHARPIRAIERLFPRLDDGNLRERHAQCRMRLRVEAGDRVRERHFSESADREIERLAGTADQTGECRPRQLGGLDRLCQLVPRDGDLGVGARFVHARTKLVRHQRPYAGHENLQTIDVRLRRPHPVVRRKGRQKGVRRRRRDINLGELLTRHRLRALRPRHIDRRFALPEVDGVPGQQRAGGASPDAVHRAGPENRARDRGHDRLRQDQAEHVVVRGTVFLPEQVELRQVGRLGDADAFGGGLRASLALTDRRIVLHRQLDRVIEGDHGGADRGSRLPRPCG